MSHDNMMSVPDAARFLGVTDRTVRNYIKKGLLTKERDGRKVFLRSEEVVELKEDFSSAAPVVSRQELLKQRAKIRRLEAHMEVVLRILDTKDHPLQLGVGSAEELYEFAKGHLQQGRWEVAEIRPWADIFDRLSEDDFEIMSGKTADPHPWRPFLRLCAAMITFVVNAKEYTTSLELQSLHRILVSSRRRLRISAFIYGEMNQSLGYELQSPNMASSSTADALFRKILKNG